MLLLKKNTTKKKRVNKKVIELEANNNKEYEVEEIQNSVVYANKEEGYLPGLYYQIAKKK